jgi:putative membrane protein
VTSFLMILTLGIFGSVSSNSFAEMPMSDSAISSIMTTANEAEIAAGQTAEKQATHKDVKDFAKHMVTEHTKNKKEGQQLAKKESIKPESNTKSETLKKDADAKLAEMKKLTGPEFDKAYIDEQVTMHKQLLSDLETNLIPAATNAKMKTFLETTKTHVQEHLSKAEKIQTALNK